MRTEITFYLNDLRHINRLMEKIKELKEIYPNIRIKVEVRVQGYEFPRENEE